MRGNDYHGVFLKVCVAAGLLFLSSAIVQGQDGRRSAPSSPPPSEVTPEVRVLADLIRDLQAQLQTLNLQLNELRTEEQRTSEEARELRSELDLAKAKIVPVAKESPSTVQQGAPAYSESTQ
jgi:uncharacterized coiled-coil DUF342 family protein